MQYQNARLSQPLTPPSSSQRPPTLADQSRAPGTRTQQTFFKADEYMANMVPGWKPMTEEEFHQAIKLCHPDANEDNMQRYVDGYNERVESIMRGPGMRAMGVCIVSSSRLL